MKVSAPIQSVYIILFSNKRQPRRTDVSQGFLESLDRDLNDDRVCELWDRELIVDRGEGFEGYSGGTYFRGISGI